MIPNLIVLYKETKGDDVKNIEVKFYDKKFNRRFSSLSLKITNLLLIVQEKVRFANSSLLLSSLCAKEYGLLN